MNLLIDQEVVSLECEITPSIYYVRIRILYSSIDPTSYTEIIVSLMSTNRESVTILFNKDMHNLPDTP